MLRSLGDSDSIVAMINTVRFRDLTPPSLQPLSQGLPGFQPSDIPFPWVKSGAAQAICAQADRVLLTPTFYAQQARLMQLFHPSLSTRENISRVSQAIGIPIQVTEVKKDKSHVIYQLGPYIPGEFDTTLNKEIERFKHSENPLAGTFYNASPPGFNIITRAYTAGRYQNQKPMISVAHELFHVLQEKQVGGEFEMAEDSAQTKLGARVLASLLAESDEKFEFAQKLVWRALQKETQTDLLELAYQYAIAEYQACAFSSALSKYLGATDDLYNSLDGQAHYGYVAMMIQQRIQQLKTYGY